MKDMTQEQIESARPSMSSLELVEFCLSALYRDTENNFGDSINTYLTFEELLGALLKARDDLQDFEKLGYL